MAPSSRTCDRTKSRPPRKTENRPEKRWKNFRRPLADGKRKKFSSAAKRPMTTDESQHEHRVINTPAASRVQDRCEDVASEATEFARARDNDRDRNRWNGKEASPKDFLRVLTDATPPTENVRPPARRNSARRTEIPAGRRQTHLLELGSLLPGQQDL